jgi:hypothetical protein
VGILEIIANPYVPSAMEQLKTQDMIEARRSRRSMQALQRDQIQQSMRLEQEQAQQKAQSQQAGRAIIGGTSSPLDQATDAIKDIPAQQLEKMDYEQIGRQLAQVPGREQSSQFYLKLGQKSKELVQKQTKEERADAERLYELTASPMKEVAELTDAGQLGQAKALYERTMGFIRNDTRVKENKEVRDFFESITEYQPGLAKFVYASTRSNKKAREATTAHQKVLEEQADRRAGIAERGLEIREQTQADKQYNQRIKTTTGLRKEYKAQTSEISGALEQIKLARAALERNGAISDKMGQAILSKVANSKVRALAELNQYKNFGSLQGRVSGFFSRVILGKYSVAQRKEALDALGDIEKTYQRMKGEAKEYFQYLAEGGQLDSHAIAKYDNPEEVAKNPYLSREQKIAVLKRAFPKQFQD